jgi:thioredoxin reductase
MNDAVSVGSPSAIDTAIIGAGPYGLAVAAHLSALKVPHRIFGKPMALWLDNMPRGMLLKSEPFATNLFHPDGRFTLSDYCREMAEPYSETRAVSLDTFCRYGLAFQQRFVPYLETTLVKWVSKDPVGYRLSLQNGESVVARRVVVAVGVEPFAHVPPVLAGLPPQYLSHSREIADVTAFKGRDLVVVGSGASAIDIAALAHEAGVSTTLASRRSNLEMLASHEDKPARRSLRSRVPRPRTGLGPSWKSWFFIEFATLFHYLPLATRHRWVLRHLGPAGGPFMRDRIAPVPQYRGYAPVDAQTVGSRVRLTLKPTAGGETRVVEADHVVAGTGFVPSIKRLTFLDPALCSVLKTEHETPVLTYHFESSAPGLYFIGPIAANSFGPLMRFTFGANYAAKRVTRHLVGSHAP